MQAPTQETYDALRGMFDALNAQLFDGQLPSCLITLQRTANVFGYFCRKRFANGEGVQVDEIALNPEFFGTTPLLELLQTLAHEMCHMWQHHFGTPTRNGYHNQQWARKMESIGLMPSDTGRPGGKKTGQKVMDYAMPGGRFLAVAQQIIQTKPPIWFDRQPPYYAVLAGHMIGEGLASVPDRLDLAEQDAVQQDLQGVFAELLATPELLEPKPKANRSNRVRYQCACGTRLWAKPDIRVSCDDCGQQFFADES